MRYFLLTIGRLISFIYPNSIHNKFVSAFDLIYTGWQFRGFKKFAVNSKLSHNMHIVGKEYIEIGQNIYIGANTILTAFCVDGDKTYTRIKIGDNCMFGNDCHITAIKGIVIGKNLRTGKSVLISDNSHGNPSNIDQRKIHPNDRPPFSKGPITIGDNVWIGEGSVILSDVTIGDGVIIGANTVVTHDVPKNSIVVGCSGKLLNIR